ncbi:hypothetical protein [Shewanella sp. W3-18-1]|nr:hypothetical protein [Shewanella sp. W3-18-1]
MEENTMLVEQMQMLIDMYNGSGTEARKDLAVSIMALVLAAQQHSDS